MLKKGTDSSNCSVHITSPESTTATFAYDTAEIATGNDPAIAPRKQQTSLLTIQHWLKNGE
jgi:hypothetical protein